MLPPQTEVLVVGAGPVGLACAITLTKAGRNVTIVDLSSSNVNGCRAVAIHANTLENLAVIDAAKPLIDVGIRGAGAALFEGESNIFRIDVEPDLAGKTDYPFILLVAQEVAERVLERRLKEEGVTVVRNKKVVSFEQTDGGIQVLFEGGEQIKTRYLVGTDGVRSTIRSLAGLEFKDPGTGLLYGSPQERERSGITRILLADVYLSTPVPKAFLRDRITGHFSVGTISILIPLHPPQVYDGEHPDAFFRFVTFLIDGEEPPKDPDISYIQGLIDRRNVDHTSTPIRLSKVLTASRYRVRSAIASKFFLPYGAEGKILLAGDSAHCHSPAGAQGVNLGICDAVALGRAIAIHAKNDDRNDDTVLRAYSDRRREIALEIISLAEGITSLNTMSFGWRRWFRNALLYIVWSIPMIRTRIPWRMSGLGYRNPEVLEPLANI